MLGSHSHLLHIKKKNYSHTIPVSSYSANILVVPLPLHVFPPNNYSLNMTSFFIKKTSLCTSPMPRNILSVSSCQKATVKPVRKIMIDHITTPSSSTMERDRVSARRARGKPATTYMSVNAGPAKEGGEPLECWLCTREVGGLYVIWSVIFSGCLE